MWNPEQYAKFEKERDQPFYDLIDLIEPLPEMHVVDLGCGTGALTAQLHDRLHAKETLGIDNSKEMFSQCHKVEGSTLHFKLQSIEEFAKQHNAYDLIFANASLQWLPNHRELLSQLSKQLTSRGQLAIHMPSNYEYVTHTLALQLGKESPYKEAIVDKFPSKVAPPEEYSQILNDLGFKRQLVRLQVYGHLLESSESLFEWVKGSLLTWYRARLSPELYASFLEEYRERLMAAVGVKKPFFMPFKRLLIWSARD